MAVRSPRPPLGPGFRALFWGSLVSNTGDGIRLAALPLLAAGLTSSPPDRNADASPRVGLLASSREGFRFLWGHGVLGPVSAATAVYYLGAATGMSLLVLLVIESAGSSTWAFGVVLACGALGAFAGTLVAGRVVTRLGVRATMASAIGLQGVALAAMAAPSSVVLLAAIWFVGGVPAGVQIPVARSLQQRLTPNELLGRVNVSARMVTRGVIVVGALTGGAIASAVGLRQAFVAAGVVEVIAAVLLARALSRLTSRDRHTPFNAR